MVENVRAEPRLAGLRLALKGERPFAERCALRYERCRLEELVPVRIAIAHDPGGEGVRGEDHVGARGWRIVNAIRQPRDEARLRSPFANEARLHAGDDRQ